MHPPHLFCIMLSLAVATRIGSGRSGLKKAAGHAAPLEHQCCQSDGSQAAEQQPGWLRNGRDTAAESSSRGKCGRLRRRTPNRTPIQTCCHRRRAGSCPFHRAAPCRRRTTATTTEARPERGLPRGSHPSQDRLPRGAGSRRFGFPTAAPFALLIEPDAIAAWIAVKGSFGSARPLAVGNVRGARDGRRRGSGAVGIACDCNGIRNTSAGRSNRDRGTRVDRQRVLQDLRSGQAGGVGAVADHGVAGVGRRGAGGRRAADDADHLVRAGDREPAARCGRSVVRDVRDVCAGGVGESRGCACQLQRGRRWQRSRSRRFRP